MSLDEQCSDLAARLAPRLGLQEAREQTLQARHESGVSTASLGNPMLIGGEEVKWIRVGATYGGESTLAYITASGKEVRLH